MKQKCKPYAPDSKEEKEIDEALARLAIRDL